VLRDLTAEATPVHPHRLEDAVRGMLQAFGRTYMPGARWASLEHYGAASGPIFDLFGVEEDDRRGRWAGAWSSRAAATSSSTRPRR
jgi:hypothetical protein